MITTLITFALINCDILDDLLNFFIEHGYWFRHL